MDVSDSSNTSISLKYYRVPAHKLLSFLKTRGWLEQFNHIHRNSFQDQVDVQSDEHYQQILAYIYQDMEHFAYSDLIYRFIATMSKKSNKLLIKEFRQFGETIAPLFRHPRYIELIKKELSDERFDPKKFDTNLAKIIHVALVHKLHRKYWLLASCGNKIIRDSYQESNINEINDQGNRLVGMLRCAIEPIEDSTFLAFIDNYCVDPKIRNKGIGRRLYHRIDGLMRLLSQELGAKQYRFSLEVFSDNKKAIHFYRKLGFFPTAFGIEMSFDIYQFNDYRSIHPLVLEEFEKNSDEFFPIDLDKICPDEPNEKSLKSMTKPDTLMKTAKEIADCRFGMLAEYAPAFSYFVMAKYALV